MDQQTPPPYPLPFIPETRIESVLIFIYTLGYYLELVGFYILGYIINRQRRSQRYWTGRTIIVTNSSDLPEWSTLPSDSRGKLGFHLWTDGIYSIRQIKPSFQYNSNEEPPSILLVAVPLIHCDDMDGSLWDFNIRHIAHFPSPHRIRFVRNTFEIGIGNIPNIAVYPRLPRSSLISQWNHSFFTYFQGIPTPAPSVVFTTTSIAGSQIELPNPTSSAPMNSSLNSSFESPEQLFEADISDQQLVMGSGVDTMV